jgi:hypothetical protein
MDRKRDMDLLRQIMLDIEDGKNEFAPIADDTRAILGIDSDGPAMSHEEAEKLKLHLTLIEKAGYVEFQRSGGGFWFVDQITGPGYDFIDSVRDEAVWRKTKEGAAKAGGFTLELVAALAKGFLKKQIEDRTGIEIDL